MPPVRILLSTRIFCPRPLDAAVLAATRSAGFDAIEVFCDRRHVAYHDPGSVAALKDSLASHGIEVLAVQLPVGLPVFGDDEAVRTQAMEEIEFGIDAAEALGARVVVLSLGQPGDTISPTHTTYAEDAIARLSGYASPRGLELACENVNSDITRVPVLATSIENVGRSMVGVCIDAATAFCEGSLESAPAAAGREFYHLQISDTDGTRVGLDPGTGVLPLSAFRSVLASVNYESLVTLELLDSTDGAAPVAELAARAARSRDVLLKAGY